MQGLYAFAITHKYLFCEQHIMSQHGTTLSRETINRWIAQGELIVVYEGCALQLGAWIDRHPGGRLAILHVVGRDATDEINM